MKFKRHVEFKRGHLDIVPLVDVVFLLLIFFMLTSSYIFQPGIKIELPKAVTSQAIEERNLIISVDAKDRIYLNKRAVTLDELSSHLQRAKEEDLPLLIKADRQASLGKVVQIWDLCREAGLTQINIATDQPAQ